MTVSLADALTGFDMEIGETAPGRGERGDDAGTRREGGRRRDAERGGGDDARRRDAAYVGDFAYFFFLERREAFGVVCFQF